MSNGNKYSQNTCKTVALAQVIRESEVKLCLKSWTNPWQTHPSCTIDGSEALRNLEVAVLLLLWGPVEARNTQFLISSLSIQHQLL